MLNPGELNSLFIQTHHLHFQHAYKKYGQLGINEGQPRLLRILGKHPNLSQVELARISNLKPATITAALKRLDKLGLIRRTADENDLRIMRINLTEEGKKLNEDLKILFLEIEEDCFTGFSMEEREMMANYLLRMKENLMSD